MLTVRQFISAKLIIAILVLGGAALNASAAWGDPDTSFGSNGIYQETSPGYQLGDVVMQPDGKILVTGSKLASNGKKRFFLRRYLSNGSPDLSFGNNGSAVVNVLLNSNYDYGGFEIKMLTYSKIVVLGHSNNNLAVWLINGDGYGNADFGTNGFKSLTAYPFLRARLGALGGKTVIGLYDENIQRVYIIKLNTDGSQDMTFGNNGKSNTGIYGSGTFIPPFEMITESDTNKITVGGLTFTSDAPPIRLERKLSNGVSDLAFFSTGHGLAQSKVSWFNGLQKLSSGKYIYNFLNVEYMGLHYGYLSRVSPSGGLEERISSGAVSQVHGVQPDGKIVVEAGYFFSRYDQNFNGQGTFQPYPAISSYESRRFAFQADNKMIVAGILDDKLTITRLLAD